MAIRNIVRLGDLTLRRHSRVVEKFDRRLGALLDDMAETMYEAEGVGLAAVQVGVLKRMAVIDVGDGLLELVNPEIVEEEGTQWCLEGCLSVPNRRGVVKRPLRVRLKAQDRKGNPFELEAEDFLANAICHELDHLDGIVYVDKMKEEVTGRDYSEVAEEVRKMNEEINGPRNEPKEDGNEEA